MPDEQMEKPGQQDAFPPNEYPYRGMTLRQYYVGQAIAGLCANPDFIASLPSAVESEVVSGIGLVAVEIADAALREEAK